MHRCRCKPGLPYWIDECLPTEQSTTERSARDLSRVFIFRTRFTPPRHLSFSAGVRWDPVLFPVDYFGRGSVFSMSGFESNIFSTVFPNAPAGSFFYGDTGVPKAFTKNSPWQFSPRFGATLDPFGNGKTVFRAGAALVYDEPNFFTGQRRIRTRPSPNYLECSCECSDELRQPMVERHTATNPFPQPSNHRPLQSSRIGAIYRSARQFHPPYTMQWTASVQQELNHGWEFQIDYIGSKTTSILTATL